MQVSFRSCCSFNFRCYPVQFFSNINYVQSNLLWFLTFFLTKKLNFSIILPSYIPSISKLRRMIDVLLHIYVPCYKKRVLSIHFFQKRILEFKAIIILNFQIYSRKKTLIFFSDDRLHINLYLPKKKQICTRTYYVKI